MSLTIPSHSESAAVHPSAGPVRNGQTDPGGSGSFGEALSRATQPDRQTTEKPAEKAAAGTPGRRHGGSAKAEADEQVEPVNLLGHAPLDIRARPAPLAGGSAKAEADEQVEPVNLLGHAPLDMRARPAPLAGGTAPPAGVAPAGQVAAETLPQIQADVLPADPLMARPDAASDAGPAAGLVLAGANPRDREMVSVLATQPTSGSAAPVPDPVALTQGVTAALTATEQPAFMPTLATDPESLDKEGLQAGNGLQTRAAEPAVSPAMLRQAPSPPASDAETPDTAASASPPLPPAPGGDTGAITGLPVTGAPAQGATVTPGPALPAPITTLTVRPEVGSSEWGQALSQQLAHLGRAGHETAELQLNPPGLGPLKVSLSMNDHQIQATFVSAHSSVRAAVEAALPQLRASLADSGISLGDTSVSSGNRQQADVDQGQGQGERPGHHSQPSAGLRASAPMVERSLMASRPQGGGASIDTYA